MGGYLSHPARPGFTGAKLAVQLFRDSFNIDVQVLPEELADIRVLVIPSNAIAA